ncbi:MAG: hypothetical protein ACRD0A_06750 [Acidimicrobiales bacterium]
MTWLDLPPGWVTGAARRPLVGTARPERWDGPFVPNLVVAVEPVDEPWPDYAERSTAALVDVLALPILIDARVDEGQLQIVVGHELFGRRLTLVQRHVGAAGRAAVASFTVADVDWPGLCRQILASVATLKAPS